MVLATPHNYQHITVETVWLHCRGQYTLQGAIAGHFPGEPGLAGVTYWSKDDGGSSDNWTTGAISHAMLQSNHHHQQTALLNTIMQVASVLV